MTLEPAWRHSIVCDQAPCICKEFEDERSTRIENLARDLAAVRGCTLEEAREAILAPTTVRDQNLADTLISDDPGLD